jgi:hypothetical protein
VADPACSQAIDLFPDHLAAALTPADRAALVAHLRGCEDCHDKLIALELYVHLTASTATREEAR